MATDANRYAHASQTYLTQLSLRPKQDQARRASIKADRNTLATAKTTAAKELLQKCQAEKKQMEEEGEEKMKELKAKHEQQLADLKKAQEVEKEKAENAWNFKMEMEETRIAGREAGLEREWKEKEVKMEEEWVEKRKQWELKWAKEDEQFNDLRREIQTKRSLVSRVPGSEMQEVRPEQAPYRECPANEHSNRVGDSDRLSQESGPRRNGERERSRDREFHGFGNSRRPSPGRFRGRDERPRGGASYRPRYEDPRGRSPIGHDTWRPPPRSWEERRPVSAVEVAQAKLAAAQARSEEARLYLEMIEAAERASDNGPSRPGPTNYNHRGQYGDGHGDYGRGNGYRGPPERRNASPPHKKATHRLSPSPTRDEGATRKRAKREPREGNSKSKRKERRAEAARMEGDNSQSRPQSFTVSNRPNTMVPGGFSATSNGGGSLPKKPEVSGK